MSMIQNIRKSGSGLNAAMGLLIFLVGCASADTTVSNPYMGPVLPRPERILIYDFTSDLRMVPSNSPLQRQLAGMTSNQSPEGAQLSQQLGGQIANDLVGQVRSMGLPAYRVAPGSTPRPGDIVLMGYFLTLDEGNAAKRVGLGFGSGAAELKITVEGYEMTPRWMRFLGSAEGEAGSGKTPGGAASLGVAIATANPVGLIIGGAMKAHGEMSGKETIQGASNRITPLIAQRLHDAFKRQFWI